MAIAELDPSTSDVKAERPTRMRYFMLFFILVATIINYVDRTNLGIATPFLTKELGLDKAQMGQIFAAFGLLWRAISKPASAEHLWNPVAVALSGLGVLTAFANFRGASVNTLDESQKSNKGITEGGFNSLAHPVNRG